MFGWFKKKQSAAPNGPDFSAIDSLAKAQEAVRRGEMERLFVLPLEFGGAEIPENTLYVPPWVCATKAGFDNDVIRPMVEQGMSVQYSGIPEYQGRSFIPNAITLVVAPDRGGQVNYTIKIWGDALARDESA
jgi:hypothetical protein